MRQPLETIGWPRRLFSHVWVCAGYAPHTHGANQPANQLACRACQLGQPGQLCLRRTCKPGQLLCAAHEGASARGTVTLRAGSVTLRGYMHGSTAFQWNSGRPTNAQATGQRNLMIIHNLFVRVGQNFGVSSKVRWENFSFWLVWVCFLKTYFTTRNHLF